MRTRRRMPDWPTGGHVLFALCLLLPALLGGCPDYRNDVVGAIETATRSLLITAEDQRVIAETARDSIIDASIDLFFDQFRADTVR